MQAEVCTQLSVYSCTVPCAIVRGLFLRQAEGNWLYHAPLQLDGSTSSYFQLGVLQEKKIVYVVQAEST